MGHSVVAVRRRAVLLIVLFGGGMAWACRDVKDLPTGPATVASSPRPDVDPDPNNPNNGCWVSPEPASWGTGNDGGTAPYTVSRCGVNVSLSWPGFVASDFFTYTRVRNGTHTWPWLHSPGFLGANMSDGWPWTITFGTGVKNVRIYTRWADFTGGTVVLKGSTGAVIATRSIPLSPTYFSGTQNLTGIVDTLAFSDSNVFSFEIKPALDPNYPNAPGELMGWQAQFEKKAFATLDCENFQWPIPLRGAVRKCVASSQEPQRPLVITAWSFTSDSGDIVDRTENVSDSIWQGRVVRTGHVKVRGTIGGESVTASAIIEVAPRSWTADSLKRPDTVNVVQNPGPLTSKPAAIADLGRAFGELIVNYPKMNQWLKSIDDNGPNHGWIYLLKMPAKESSLVHVNTAALADTSAFYRVQYDKDKTVGGVKYCGKDWVKTKFRPLADAHEGTTPESQPNSHIGVHRRTVDSAFVAEFFEKFAGPQTRNINQYTDSMDTRADTNSRWMDTTKALNNINSKSFPCQNFVYTYPP